MNFSRICTLTQILYGVAVALHSEENKFSVRQVKLHKRESHNGEIQPRITFGIQILPSLMPLTPKLC